MNTEYRVLARKLVNENIEYQKAENVNIRISENPPYGHRWR